MILKDFCGDHRSLDMDLLTSQYVFSYWSVLTMASCFVSATYVCSEPTPIANLVDREGIDREPI